MAPNPIAIPRVRATGTSRPQGDRRRKRGNKLSHISLAILLSSSVVLLASALPWARRWLLAGAAIESALLLYGASTGSRVLPEVSLWLLLSVFNLAYAVASTSWLLHGGFVALCYPLIFLTCLSQFDSASDLARRWLRKLLRGLHFTRDKIALFNLPALEIDTDVSGLFVARGITISLSSLTIVAHGIELGLLVADDIEMSIYADKVTIRLFRDIKIGDVYGNLKGGKSEMTFTDMDAATDSDDDSIFQKDTPLLRAASGRDGRLKPERPDIARAMTGGADMTDSSVKESLNAMKALSADDEQAEREYEKIVQEILKTSHITQAHQKVRDSRSGDAEIKGEKEMRAAVCAELQDMPSVPHAPARSVKVTTLQTLSPPHVRRFLHRLPFLLRLLLMPLGLFHPITIDSISVAGSGKWLTAMLQQKIFKQYSSQDAQVRRLERKILTWLADANFCMMLGNIDGLGHVPVNPSLDIVNYLHFADIMAFRTAQTSGDIEQIIHLGGADATITVPSFLLPHHEHLLPPKPTTKDQADQKEVIAEAEGRPQEVKAEKELEKLQEDETEVGVSVHVMLPLVLNQSLLNFVAALVKATKIIEMDKSLDEGDDTDSVAEDSPLSPSDTNDSASVSSTHVSASSAAVRNFARGIRQNIKDGRTGESIKDLARDLKQSTKDGMKKAVVGGVVNDRWIAKMVGKIAVKLESAQGDVGYSGAVPVPLAPYRDAAEPASKLLP